jgi:outer membrane protein OmpA-like peptidoglycan-associated protein
MLQPAAGSAHRNIDFTDNVKADVAHAHLSFFHDGCILLSNHQRRWVCSGGAVAAATLDRIAAYVAVAGAIGIGAYLVSEQPASTSAVNSVATKIAELDARISALPAPDPALRSDLDELRSTVEGWTARSVAAERSVAELEVRFAALVPADPGLRADLSLLQAALENRISRLEENAREASPETDALAAKVAELGSQLDQGLASLPVPDVSLRGDLEALRAALKAVSDGHATVLAELDDKVADIDRRITALSADTRSPRVQAGVEAKLAELDAGISEPATSDPTLRADLDALKSTFDDWRMESAKSHATLSTKVAGLGQLLATLPTPDPNLRSDLETLRSAMESQSTQSAASTADLEMKLANLDALWAESSNARVDVLPSSEALSSLEVRVADLEQARRKPARPTRVLETLFFKHASSELGDEESAKLRGLADRMAEGSLRVAIIGFTDTVGPPDYNRSLSLRRAAKVRTMLLGHGVEPTSIISVDGVGEDSTLVRTTDGEALANNRAVVVYTYE